MIATVKHHFAAVGKPIRVWLAQRRLAKLVEDQRQSFETESYRRHRAAALRGLGR